MVLFAEKSKTKLIFRKQKFPLNGQNCPFGRLIKSVLLEVKALLQIQIQMQIQMLLPFPSYALSEYGLWHWHWLVSSGIVSFVSVAVSLLN